MDKVLPRPIDHFLLQADLTVVVPGPLERDLAEQLAAVARVESAGAAMVYRISEASIRRALDTGRTAVELHAFFSRHSKTPVPQGLTYLIDDVARRHGQLRVGMAASFVRCEDPALLAQAITAPAAEPLEMRLLAPTVAVSQAPISEVLTGLREAGFAPAAEDSTGTIVDIRARGARVPAPPRRRAPHRPANPTSQTLGAIVAVLRKVAAAPSTGMRLDPTVAITQLQEAAHLQASVVIGYVDPAGVATQRVVAPINVRGGQLTAYDPASGQGARVRDPPRHVGGVRRLWIIRRADGHTGSVQINGSVAFVTGANRGLGRHFAEQLVARGAAKVYAAARRPETITLQNVVPVRIDITDVESVAAAADVASDTTLLINNAGIASFNSLLERRWRMSARRWSPTTSGRCRSPGRSPRISSPMRRPRC